MNKLAIDLMPWKGGEMPIPEGTRVIVQHRDGDILQAVAGEGYAENWAHINHPGDIIAYAVMRVHSQPQIIKLKVWKGGEMPVAKGVFVLVQHRCGEIFGDCAGEGYAEEWDHNGDPGDIIAYAPVVYEVEVS